MNLIKNKKVLIFLTVVGTLYLLLSFIVASSAFSIGDEVYNATPRNFDIDYEEIKIETEGSYISTWWIPSNSESTIIILHGLRSQKASPEILNKIKFFNEQGISLIAIDFRNHGLSGEGNFTFGIEEVDDVYATINHFYENEGLKSFGIWGFSYGATTALLSGFEFYNNTSNVELIGIFAESPYLDLLEVFTDQVSYRTPLNKTMANLLKPGTIFLTNLIFDFDFNSINKTFDSNKEFPFPTAVLSCSSDEIVPKSQSKRIVKILGSNAVYEEFGECSGHGYIFESDSTRYTQILRNLFK
tara:strand:+ start:322 stop:1221 length:900 start_codon:yes stop_codon:yes gene_type:complete